MIDALLILFTIFLIGVAIVDYKYKAIPSIVLTAMIFVLLFLRFDNLQYALIMGVFGILIWEFAHDNEVSFGLADIKVLIMIGFFISNLMSATIFLICFGFGQIIYLGVMRKWSNHDEVPFLPMLLGLWIGGLLGGIWV
jgi:signal transduction histidine kinase